MEDKSAKNPYQSTLNLPQTDFSIRANAQQKELELLHTQDLQEMKQLEEELRLQEKAIGGVGGTVEKDPGLL